MKLVEEKLASLEEVKQQKNNGRVVFSEIDNLIKASIENTIRLANETESIDERIKTLVLGLQEIMNILNSYGTDFASSDYILNAKISVLEELLDDYIKNENSENTQE